MDRLPVIFVDGLPVMEDKEQEENIRAIQKMTLRNDDLVVATYPKCGTTWVQYIVWSIQNRGKTPLPDFHDLLTKVAPYLEMVGPSKADVLPSPRHLKIHLPFHMTPYNANAKYIYVARNPFDTVVSCYHFYQQLYGQALNFDGYVDQFLEGCSSYGDYFDHFLGWYKYKDDDNVLFLFYEDIQQDHRAAVLNIAKFISDENNDYEAELMANDERLLNCIVINTTFSNMKKSIKTELNMKQVDFFRKGMVGDGKCRLNDKQKLQLREKMSKTFASINGSLPGLHYN